MNQSVISQVFAVLDKYDKSYTKDGVLKNLNTWEQNKSPLVDLLRKHPTWDESALAVIFDVTQSRELDHYDVSTYHRDLSALVEDLEMSPDDANNLRCSLSIATGCYTKLLPDERTVSDIKYYSGVSCTMGQKASRVVHKICRKYGLDQHPEYNARFARLADSLNPLQVKRRALLSVHPCDFLEMSNEDNSWNSCHCIREGEYHAGTLSYMNDGVSMIFYTDDGIEYINCECCGERIERESEDDYYVGNGHYCRDCVSWCDCCLEYTRDDMTYVYDRDGHEISVCEYCRDEYYEDCEDCGRYFHRDTGKELDDGFHCNDCLERRYFTCDRCGDYVRCEDTGEIDGKIYCQDCTEAVREELEEIEAECFATA